MKEKKEHTLYEEVWECRFTAAQKAKEESPLTPDLQMGRFEYHSTFSLKASR